MRSSINLCYHYKPVPAPVANQDIVTVVRERGRMRVSAKEWEAYELHNIKHRTYQEIAEQVDISEATAMNYVSKVRKVLAEELKMLEED